ncbi:phenazine biosynthesis protein PhzF family [Saccharopolyspora kobensis]|uniref:Phenazine biosynthesis protein PhzF family n=1 Tax=Saccharopolyspora kobensis TaxID=146035 RepID=A0A1H6EEN1_9PSEU|nr:PhzF family phenazine biosynthesis isomerase [Saccharopolyspora kobensis]SEG95324.1 phenazine biosynthesis protein PhzF family [Saccharopolyspora kobensis]SFD57513.1 phenazine biosynthesis protein PhzF family [Saccharopolyspora kobensis]
MSNETTQTEIQRLVGFSSDPNGGNPAGVVLDAVGLSDAEMLRIAADVGYSETAFVFPRGEREHDIRFFSPKAEVSFCGHATIATAVALAERDGTGRIDLHTRAGLITVDTQVDDSGRPTATLTSVPTSVRDVEPAILDEALAALGWSSDDLDPELPPRIAFGGNDHLVLAVSTREKLAALSYDFDRLGKLMADQDWTTLQLVWRESPELFHARDPFPPGGVVEDAATGAAAAAFGGYLKHLGLIAPPTAFRIHQGFDMGRPSILDVEVAADHDRIRVTGTATRIR